MYDFSLLTSQLLHFLHSPRFVVHGRFDGKPPTEGTKDSPWAWQSTTSLAAVLGKVLIHLDARPFAPAVNPSGLVKGVDECFDFVAGFSQLLNGFAKLARSGCVLVQ